MTKYIYRYVLEMRDGITVANLVMINQETGEEEKTLWSESYPDNRVYLRITETNVHKQHMLHISRTGFPGEQPPTFGLPFEGPAIV
jgi:hypothetical protein